jgi:phosphoglycolate phosphatase
MSSRIFFDFDGTLIDSSRRLYSLFCELAPESSFSYQDYWRIKRGRVSQHDILSRYLDYSDARIAQFKQTWMARIEDSSRLMLDVPFEGVHELLQQLSRTHALYLVTARQYPERAKAQVASLGWREYFTEILATSQQQSKTALIRSTIACDSADIIVGDTGEDIQAGRELGICAVAVSSGSLSAEVLAEYQPDHLLENVVSAYFLKL